MTGKQHIMTGGQTTEHVILNYVIRLIFKEQIAFILIHVHAQCANFLRFQCFDGGLRINQPPTAGIDDHHTIFHLVKCGLVEQMIVFRRQRAVQGDHV